MWKIVATALRFPKGHLSGVHHHPIVEFSLVSRKLSLNMWRFFLLIQHRTLVTERLFYYSSCTLVSYRSKKTTERIVILLPNCRWRREKTSTCSSESKESFCRQLTSSALSKEKQKNFSRPLSFARLTVDGPRLASHWRGIDRRMSWNREMDKLSLSLDFISL